MTIMVFAGKLKDIIAIIAKLNGITLGEYVRLEGMREREINLADPGALDATADRSES